MNAISKSINFLKEVKVQLIKVSWPGREELISATTVVIVITLIMAVFIFLVDSILTNILSWIFR